MDYNKILHLPKTELYCHLDGSLSLACVSHLLNRKVSLKELQVADDCKDLAQYLEKFSLPLEGLQTKTGLIDGAIDFISNVAKENVQYIEVRFAPMLSTNGKLSLEDVIESVLYGLEKGKRAYGVEYNVIASLMRHHSDEDNMKVIKVSKEFLGKGLCALDLAGNEKAFPMVQFNSVFSYANELGVPFIAHAGECGEVINVKDSVNIGAKRIGHGIALRNDIDILREIKEYNVGIELCPISNLQTKAVNCKEEYPIRMFLENNLLVTLNTDNRMVSNSSLTKEIQFVQKNFGVSDEDIFKMLFNSIDVSFASEDLKRTLKRNLRSFL